MWSYYGTMLNGAHNGKTKYWFWFSIRLILGDYCNIFQWYMTLIFDGVEQNVNITWFWQQNKSAFLDNVSCDNRLCFFLNVCIVMRTNACIGCTVCFDICIIQIYKFKVRKLQIAHYFTASYATQMLCALDLKHRKVRSLLFLKITILLFFLNFLLVFDCLIAPQRSPLWCSLSDPNCECTKSKSFCKNNKIFFFYILSDLFIWIHLSYDLLYLFSFLLICCGICPFSWNELNFQNVLITDWYGNKYNIKIGALICNKNTNYLFVYLYLYVYVLYKLHIQSELSFSDMLSYIHWYWYHRWVYLQFAV